MAPNPDSASVANIKRLEERLRQAELAPDPNFFDQVLAHDAVLDGAKQKVKVVGAHQPGAGPKFTKVEMSNFSYVDHGDAVVVTCTGTYESPTWSGSLKFMRVWHKQEGRWQIIAATTTPV